MISCQVVSFRQRDVLLCLHENGSLSARIRRKTNAITTPASEGHGAFGGSLSLLWHYINRFIFAAPLRKRLIVLLVDRGRYCYFGVFYFKL